MKKGNGNIFYGILFGLLMVFLFSFMIQEHFKPFKTKELMGYFLKPEKPKFRWEWYKNGYFQQSIEKYITNNYGFREPIIRLYHQYCWDFFGKEYVSYIYSGKERWLYYDHNIEDYYGTEMYHWYPDAEAARQGYEQEVRLLNKVKGILEDYDVTLMTFIAPSKNVIYPEYLPRREKDTTTLNPREYFARRFKETGMPCFEMNDYFMKMKDTCSFYLFPPTGDHWTFSCVYATDSLLRFMEQQRGIKLPHIEYGNEYHTECRIGDDQNRDLEGELNLLRPITFNPKYAYKELDYWVVSDSTTVKPSALFIGNSFLLRTIAYVPPKEVFSDFQFWYYNRVAYQGLDRLIDSVSFLNRLDYLLDADYIVWFSSASQMYRATEGFAEDAIIQLCIGDERFRQRQNELADSLQLQPGQVAAMLRKNPEAYFPEIAGEGIPTARNPILLTDDCWKRRDIRRQIKSDPQWMLAVSSQMALEGITLQQAIDNETEQVMQGQPAMRDKNIGPKEYREILIKQMEQKIRYDKDWLKVLTEEAASKGLDLDAWIYENAAYMVDMDIHEGKIKLPEPIEEIHVDTAARVRSEIEKLINDWRNDPQMINFLEEKAKKNGKTFETVLQEDAQWVVNERLRKGELF